MRTAYRAATASVPRAAAPASSKHRGAETSPATTRQPQPIFLLGEAGAGKSALLAAAASVAQQSGLTVAKTSGQSAIESLLEAHRRGRRNAYCQSLTEADLLLVDDVEGWAGHPSAAPHLVGVLDARLSRRLPTVVAARTLVGRIAGLDDRLRDRLRGGTVCTLRPLSLASRRTMLEHFAERHHVRFVESALLRLAEQLPPTPRVLAEAVATIAPLGRRNKGLISVAIAGGLLRTLKNRATPLSILEYERAVAAEFGVTASRMRSSTREAAVAVPRQVAMYLARELGGATYEAIGTHFGGRNHSTVMHACRRVSTLLGADTELASRVERVRQSLAARAAA